MDGWSSELMWREGKCSPHLVRLALLSSLHACRKRLRLRNVPPLLLLYPRNFLLHLRQWRACSLLRSRSHVVRERNVLCVAICHTLAFASTKTLDTKDYSLLYDSDVFRTAYILNHTSHFSLLYHLNLMWCAVFCLFYRCVRGLTVRIWLAVFPISD